jgi:hypothetical protein
MHSPDRRYWWDGAVWVLAVSADGRLWFDGREWVSNPLRAPAHRREPTKWTRPLQLLVVAVAVLSSISVVATLPYALSVMPPTVVYGPADVPPAEAQQMIQSSRVFMTASFIAAVAFGVGIMIVMIVGALYRWMWAFWLALVMFGLSTIGIILASGFGLLASVGVTLPGPPGPTTAHVPPVPAGLQISGWLLNAAETLTFILLLIAAVRIGPWGCRNEIAEDPSPPSARPG